MTGVKRALVLLVTTILCFILQMMVFPRVDYLITVPNMMLIEVISAGFLYGRKLGLLTGVICGLLLDIMGTGTPGFHVLILMWLGYGNGYLSEKMESELIPVLILLFLGNETLYHSYVFLCSFLIRMHFDLGTYLRSILLPETLMTLLLFLVVYGILGFVSRRWDLKVNKGEVRVV